MPGREYDATVEGALLRREVRVAVEEEAEEEFGYGVDDGLGDVPLAEEVEVPLPPAGIAPLLADALRRRVDLHHPGDALRQVGGDAPGGRRALVVPDDDEPLVAEMVHQRGGVRRHIAKRVGRRVGGGAGLAVAAAVGRDDGEPLGEGGRDFLPRPARSGEAVQQEDGEAAAGRLECGADAVDGCEARLAHGSPRARRS